MRFAVALGAAAKLVSADASPKPALVGLPPASLREFSCFVSLPVGPKTVRDKIAKSPTIIK